MVGPQRWLLVEGTTCWVESKIELSWGTREDHKLLCALVPPGHMGEKANTDQLPSSTRRSSKLDISRVKNSECVRKFQECLLESAGSDLSPWEGSIDEATAKLTECVQTAGTKAFGPLPSKKKKHWITDETWDYIKEVSIVRRLFIDLDSSVTLCLVTCFFQAWKVEVGIKLSLQQCPADSVAERTMMKDKSSKAMSGSLVRKKSEKERVAVPCQCSIPA